jgi:protocatechuate 3,4-dioxygenase beta subunit
LIDGDARYILLHVVTDGARRRLHSNTTVDFGSIAMDRPQTPLVHRRALASWLTAPLIAALGGAQAVAQTLPATPSCGTPSRPTQAQTEGPYFKPRSPERADLVEPDTRARLVELSGLVLTRSCRPVARALLDLWHADERGDYDNAGFRYRGHLFTDGDGRYRFRTIVPALYPGRTRHYHVKVQAPDRPVLTTQLYFPDEPMNRRDGLFRRELVMRMPERGQGSFDFVVA